MCAIAKYKDSAERLETLGEAPMGRCSEPFQVKAHSKRDPVSGDWLLLGVSNGVVHY